MPTIFPIITIFLAKLRKKNSALVITTGLLFRFNKRAIVQVKSPKWTHYNGPFLDTRQHNTSMGQRNNPEFPTGIEPMTSRHWAGGLSTELREP